MQGLIQTSVPTEVLTKLNSRKRSIESIFTAVGPAMGAGSIALVGISGAILINSITFLLAAGVLVFIVIQKSHVTGKIKKAFRMNSMFKESLSYLRSNKPLLSGVVLFGGANFGLMAIQANLIYIIIDYLGMSNFIAGIVLGAGGVGAIIGSFFAPKLHLKLKTGHMIVLSMFGSGILMSFMIFDSWIALALIWAFANAMVSNIVVRKSKRQFAGKCLDVSERKYHLSGILGASVLNKLLEMNILIDVGKRKIVFSKNGEEKLNDLKKLKN